tara:strand:- start:276 stop:809 length:534 start_codon:yes stop_codon:yes gene_type:complete
MNMIRVILLIISIFFILSCASSSVNLEEEFEKIVVTEDTFDINSFKSSGLKTNKQYNVEFLPESIDAWKGVFNKKDIEIRIYISHEDAKNFGMKFAESVTGEDAIISGDEILWNEGAKDRRKCVPREATSESGCDQKPRYGDFIVFGNTIILCEGLTNNESMNVCYNLKNSVISSLK